MSNWDKFVFAALVSVLDSAFSHGYHLKCLRASKAPIREWLVMEEYNLRNETRMRETGFSADDPAVLNISMFRLLDASFPIGGVIGSCLIAYFANTFGRKGGMLMTTFISFFASLFASYSKFFDRPSLLFIGQVLFGIKCGINGGLGPMYLFEISPQEIRGQVASIYGLFVSFGSVIGTYAGLQLGTKVYWPLVLSLTIIPSMLQLIFFPSCPESPKYLFVVKNKERDCRKALMWFRGNRYKEEELDKLRIEFLQRRTLGEVRLRYILNNLILRSALITSTILVTSQQLCGVTVVLMHMHNFVYTWEQVANFFNIVKAGSMVFFILVAEKKSRKTYYLASFIGMAFFSFVTCIVLIMPDFPLKFEVVGFFVTAYIVFYKFGSGAMSWFAPSEYFNTSAAPLAYCIGNAGNWLIKTCFLIFAEPLSRLLGGYSFLNYALTNAVLAYFTYTKVLDTRNKSIKDVYQSIYLLVKNN